MKAKVKELQTKQANLKKYLAGLKHIENITQKAIVRAEIDARKVCPHEEMSYAVATSQNYDYDRTSERYHCKYCGECKTLFVIKTFEWGDRAKEDWSSQQDIDLNSFGHGFFIDRMSMREDE